MVATIRDYVSTPQDGEKFVEALGVWDRSTGKPWLVVDNAEALRVVDDCSEALVLRIVDEVWHFEHYALPSGERTRVLRIPREITEYKRAQGIESITVDGDLATIECEHHSPDRLSSPSGIVILLDPSGDSFVRAL